MKHFINTLINSFTKVEYREFKYFLARRTDVSESRKDLQLLECIRNEKPLIEKNPKTVSQIKKGLKKQLEQFAILENLSADINSEIRMQIDLAKYLFHKRLYPEAWNYIVKAEQLAEKAGEYKLLDQIFDLQISYSYSVGIPAAEGSFIPDLLSKRRKNKALEIKESDTNAAYCELIYEIKKTLSQSISVSNIDELKISIFKKHGVEEKQVEDNLPSYCNYANTILIILREKKDYKTLKEYSINCYSFLHSKKLLESVSNEFVYHLLDCINISALRTKDYQTCEKFIPLCAAYITKIQGGSNEKNYFDLAKYIDLGDLYIVTNRFAQARDNWLTAKKEYAAFTQSEKIFYLLRTNLIPVHFISKEYEECIKLYREIISRDERKFLSELYIGLEYLLFIDIYAVLFYYEDGDAYYALHLLNRIKKKYAAALKSEASAREQVFIKILQKILNNAAYIKSKRFLSDTEEFVLLKPFIPGDWEVISLNSWLVSKSTHKDYYDCFLEEVKP